MTKSTKKTEQKANTIIRSLIDSIECADGHIEENDKNISWDGHIDFYNGVVDKKENYEFKVDIQIKGRTIYTKKSKTKSNFDLDVSDLKNYLIVDGTLLIVVEFKNESDEYYVFYCDLLPYNITKYLKSIENVETNKIRIELRQLKNAEALEEICRNFNINRSIQKRMNINELLNNHMTVDSKSINNFSFWKKDYTKFKPEDLIGSYQYIYTMDDNNHPIGVKYSMITSLEKQYKCPITNVEKTIEYSDVTHTIDTSNDIYTFGKAFTVNETTRMFGINICGTLNERIKQLDFVESILKNGKFLVGDKPFEFNGDLKDLERYNKLKEQLKIFRNILNKHNITKDIKLDEWEDKDFDEFNIWMNAIENGLKIKLDSESGMMGIKKIQDIKLSIIALKDSDGYFKVDSIWNNEEYKRYKFTHTIDDKDVETNNLFLSLYTDVYFADDINIKEMEKVICDCKFNDDECILLNSQLLNTLVAFDQCGDKKLLDYAMFISEILEKYSDEKTKDIYYLNRCQILKRKNELSDAELERIIDIRNTTDRDDIAISCNALLDNKEEIKIMLNKLETETINILKSFPISKYIFD